MHVDLTQPQRNILMDLVAEALREIGPEIRHTDDYTYRDDLRERRQELRALQTLLAGGTPWQAAPSPDAPSAGMIGTP